MEEEKLTGQAMAPPSGKRADVVKMLSELAPEANFDDDDTLFARIINDYADYAQLISDFDAKVAQAELKGRNARIEELMNAASKECLGDGLPHLAGSGSTKDAWRQSIFDLARKA